mmetsp:Transcript_23674/g.48994  ORF Transcript_23674/g.48994 Transcript_23674/m.48994 type:complete len:327 (+) Transcript_23674:555-1535(+)
MIFTSKAVLLALGSSLPIALCAECGFCPSGAAPQELNAMFNDTMTCGDIHDHLVGITDPNECLVEQSTLLLSNYPTQCGYCTVSAESNRCTLCSDGSTPSADAGKVTWKGAPCGQLTLAALYNGADSDTCSDLQSQLGPECGCPPVGPRCSVCADGMPVPDPSAFSKDFDMTCGEIEDYAKNVLENTDDCTYFRDRGMIDCGCLVAEPNDPPTDDSLTPEPTSFTYEPTNEPTTEPTAEMTGSPTVEGTTPLEETSNPTLVVVTSEPSKEPTSSAGPTATDAPTDSTELSLNIQNAEKDASDASGRSSKTAVLWLGITSTCFFLLR